MPVIFTGNDSDGFEVTTNSNTIFTREFEVVSNSSGRAFEFGDTNGNIYYIRGTVLSDSNYGVASFDGANTVHVSATGSIVGDTFAYGGRGSLVNEGDIVSDSYGAVLRGENSSIENFGLIAGGLTAIFLDDDDQSVFNSGILRGDSHGILTNSVLGETMTITNTGTIVATPEVSGEAGISGSAGQEIVHNRGGIFGGVRLNDGDDRYIASASGFVDGAVEGGAGDDRMRGGDQEDLFIGGTGSDQLNGRGGEDELSGLNGNDTLNGGDGDDRLVGGNGNDHLRGGADDDTLLGGNNNDTLRGGRGEDALSGGAGADSLSGGRGDDMLTGNGGADIFVFGRNAGNDRVTDYRDGSDMLDFSAFGTNFSAISAATTDRRGNAYIDLAELGGEGFIRIDNAAGDLDASDFLF